MIAMKTALITHPDCLIHQVMPGRPETPARLERVLEALQDMAFADLVRLEAPAASDEEIFRIHGKDLWRQALTREPLEPEEFETLDADTALMKGTIRAVRRQVGASLRAVEGVFNGEFEAAFCAVRPPGHHAEPERMMGFCFANGAAIAATYAVETGLARRAAVIDFDVHHGNGTQEAFWSRENLFYGSIHKSPLYPGTGDPSETGAHDTIRNATFYDIGGPAWLQLAEERLFEPLMRFAPDLLVLSAGFDAHVKDPLGAGPATEAEFKQITARLAEIAQRHSQGRLVSVLEGGYHLDALARSTAAHVRALMDA